MQSQDDRRIPRSARRRARRSVASLALPASIWLGACFIGDAAFKEPDPNVSAPDAAVALPELEASSRTLTVLEGQQAALSLRLSRAPAAPVQVTLRSSAESKLAVSPAIVVFQPADFDAPQTVHFTGVGDDDVVDETASVAVSAEGLPSITVEVAINDDDGLGLVVSPGARLEVTEGRSETLGVRLSAQPSEPVIATLVSTDASVVSFSPSALTFTPQNWSTEQNVIVSGKDDASATDNDASIQVTGAGLADVAVAVRVFDDDALGIEPSTGNLGRWTEGTTRTFTVRLLQAPPASVNLVVASTDPAVWTAAPTTLAFTPSTWNQPQTITVTAPHDVDLIDASASIVLTAAGLSTRTIVGGVRDDDTQGILASPITVGEGATRALDVRLAFRPAQDVIVNASSLAPTVATVSPATLTFTPTNYSVPQPITVAGVEDPDAAPGVATVRLEVGAAGLTTNVRVDVTDNDLLALETSLTSVSLGEAGSAAFGVRLTAMPLAPMTVNVTSADTTAATLAPSQLTFTGANWSTYQTVTVSGAEDSDLAAESVAINVAATGLAARVVTAAVADNDTQQVRISTSAVTVTEGAQGAVEVWLQYQPASDVTVTATSGNPAIATASSSLTFTPTNYSTRQTLTISGVHDLDVVNASTTITLASAGATSAAVTANVTDDDTLTLLTNVATLSVAEGGTATFQVRLSHQPPTGTTVTLSASNASASVAPASLIFSTTDWATYQTVTVTGTEDLNAANEIISLTLSAVSTGNASIEVTVADNDTLSIEPTPTTLTVAELGNSTFAVRLTAQPLANTTVSLGSSDTGAATVSSATLTFTPADWNVHQTVTVSGVADSDGTNEVVTISISSAGLATRTVTANVIDDVNVVRCTVSCVVNSNTGGIIDYSCTINASGGTPPYSYYTRMNNGSWGANTQTSRWICKTSSGQPAWTGYFKAVDVLAAECAPAQLRCPGGGGGGGPIE